MCVGPAIYWWYLRTQLPPLISLVSLPPAACYFFRRLIFIRILCLCSFVRSFLPMLFLTPSPKLYRFVFRRASDTWALGSKPRQLQTRGRNRLEYFPPELHETKRLCTVDLRSNTAPIHFKLDVRGNAVLGRFLPISVYRTNIRQLVLMC